jgi:hypothetical protein
LLLYFCGQLLELAAVERSDAPGSGVVDPRALDTVVLTSRTQRNGRVRV